MRRNPYIELLKTRFQVPLERHEELAMARFIRNIHKETCEMVVLTRAAVFHVPRTTCVFPRSRAELLS